MSLWWVVVSIFALISLLTKFRTLFGSFVWSQSESIYVGLNLCFTIFSSGEFPFQVEIFNHFLNNLLIQIGYSAVVAVVAVVAFAQIPHWDIFTDNEDCSCCPKEAEKSTSLLEETVVADLESITLHFIASPWMLYLPRPNLYPSRPMDLLLKILEINRSTDGSLDGRFYSSLI